MRLATPEQKNRLFVMSILYNIFLLGWVLNMGVMVVNGGKMPVQGDIPIENQNTHFLFQDKDEVERYYLVDIMGFGKYSWSIGDLFVIPSLTIIILYGSYSIIREIKEWHMKR